MVTARKAETRVCTTGDAVSKPERTDCFTFKYLQISAVWHNNGMQWTLCFAPRH